MYKVIKTKDMTKEQLAALDKHFPNKAGFNSDFFRDNGHYGSIFVEDGDIHSYSSLSFAEKSLQHYPYRYVEYVPTFELVVDKCEPVTPPTKVVPESVVVDGHTYKLVK